MTEEKTRNIKNGKFKILVLFVIILVAAIVIFANRWRSNVEYDKITIKGNYTISGEEILKTAHLTADTGANMPVNLEEVNLKFISDRIEKHPEIKKVNVSKEPPSELIIEITEKRPVAILNLGNEIRLIDDDMEIFPFNNFEKLYDLPVINGLRIKDADKKLDNQNKNELKVAMFIIQQALKKGRTLHNMISEINLSDSSRIIVYCNENSVPFYFPKYTVADLKNPDRYANLLMLLSEFKNFIEQKVINVKNQKIEYVDLRFSNQAIVKINNNQDVSKK